MGSRDDIERSTQDPLREKLQAHFNALPPADESAAHESAQFQRMLAESRRSRVAAAHVGFFLRGWVTVKEAVTARPARAAFAFSGVVGCILVVVLLLSRDAPQPGREQTAQTSTPAQESPPPAATKSDHSPEQPGTGPALTLASIPLGVALRGESYAQENDSSIALACDIIEQHLADAGIAFTRRSGGIVTDYRVVDEATGAENTVAFIADPRDMLIRITPKHFRPLTSSLQRVDIARVHQRIRDDIRMMARFRK